MLVIENLSYKINNKLLIKNLNFNSSKGLFYIVGPSGSGKTTLFKLIANIKKPCKGKIYSDTLGIFWQENNLLPLTGKENINLPFYLKNYKKDKNWEKYLISFFETEKFINKSILEISTGEKERIGIIKTFIHKPKVVLLDETGNSLDKRLYQKLKNFIKEYSQENLVIWINHSNCLKTQNLKQIYNHNFIIYAD